MAHTWRPFTAGTPVTSLSRSISDTPFGYDTVLSQRSTPLPGASTPSLAAREAHDDAVAGIDHAHRGAQVQWGLRALVDPAAVARLGVEADYTRVGRTHDHEAVADQRRRQHLAG